MQAASMVTPIALTNLVWEPSAAELTAAQGLVNTIFDFHTTDEVGGGARRLLASFKDQRRRRQEMIDCPASLAPIQQTNFAPVCSVSVESERSVVQDMFRGLLHSANQTFARLTLSGEHPIFNCSDSWFGRRSRMWTEPSMRQS